MARVPVADWRTDREVSTIIEALGVCYSLTADVSFVSTYDKWAALYKSMQKTITVDQANIDQLRKSYSERLFSAMADYSDMPAEREGLHPPLESQRGVRMQSIFPFRPPGGTRKGCRPSFKRPHFKPSFKPSFGSGRCRATAFHIGIIPLKSKQPSTRIMIVNYHSHFVEEPYPFYRLVAI